MAAIRIEYCAADGRHIELKSDGTIELFVNDSDSRREEGIRPCEIVTLEYRQASMLKAMIIAEAELQRQASK